MSNINKELEKILSARYGKDVRQSIHDAIEKIDGVADTAQDSATKMAAQASNHEAVARQCMESALASAESARASAEQAMSGTPEGYEALVNQVGLFDIQTSTATTLHNTKPGGYRLIELVGATEQKSLSGKNLLNVDKSLRVTGYVTLTEGLTSGTYVLSWESSVLGGTNAPLIRFVDNALNKNLSASGGTVTIELTADESKIIIYSNGYSADNSSGVTSTIAKLMLSVEGGDYEPYCGGTPSPNPEFPQVIENTFDGVEMMQGEVTVTNGNYVNTPNSVCCTNYIPCKPNDVIKINMENAMYPRVVFFSNNTYVSGETSGANKLTTYSVTVPSGVNAFKFYINNLEAITPDTVGKITLTVKGKYVGQIVESEKNLFDISSNLLSHVEFSENNGVYSGLIHRWYYFFGKGFKKLPKFKEKTQYTLSFNAYVSAVATPFFYIVYTDGTKSTIEFSSTTKTKYKITSTAGKTISHITGTYGANGDATFYLSEVQLEEGTEATPYEPYTEKVATFFLNEQLRATDRIVRMDGVINENHKKTTRVFTNNNGWYGPINTRETTAMYYIPVATKKYGEYTAISDSFTTYLSTELVSSDIVGMCCGSGNNYIYFRTTHLTMDDWKAWLSENPITVEYDLAEETYTPLDTASQLALNDMVTFDGMTYLEVDSKIPPTSISGEYGTSQVGALALENANLHDTVNLTTVKGSVANNLTTTEEGFVLDARQGHNIDKRLLSLENMGIQYLNGVTLSNYTEPMRAIVENSTDAPINDECNNTALFEVETIQDSLGRTILMQKYTSLSPYVQGVKVRFSTYDTNWTLSDWLDS